MQYYGGKAKQGKQIAKVIEEYIAQNDKGPVDHYVEPFAGCLGVMRHLTPFLDEHCVRAHASDGCPDIILLWQSLQRGTFSMPPLPITRELWRDLKYFQPPSALRAFVGFGYSFSGIFYGAYQGNTYKDGRLYENLLALAPKLEKVRFKYCDYKDALQDIPAGDRCVIYADPPYQSGTHLFGSTHPFNHTEFVETVKVWVAAGHAVFVSERSFPFGEVIYSHTRHVVTRSREGHAYTDSLFLVDEAVLRYVK